VGRATPVLFVDSGNHDLDVIPPARDWNQQPQRYPWAIDKLKLAELVGHGSANFLLPASQNNGNLGGQLFRMESVGDLANHYDLRRVNVRFEPKVNRVVSRFVESLPS
jgi:hypothetical protein